MISYVQVYANFDFTVLIYVIKKALIDVNRKSYYIVWEISLSKLTSDIQNIRTKR